MKISTKRIILIILLSGGIVWDCLCIWNVVPYALYSLSAVLIAVYSLAVSGAFLIFPALRTGEKSRTYAELTPGEKALSGTTLCLAAAWVVTYAACVVLPL